MSAELNLNERTALAAAKVARDALNVALAAYKAAGFGGHVTQPLQNALREIEYSMSEVQS